MPLPKILQQLECLDKSSPRFPDELMNLLRGKVYKRRVPKLQDEDATWLVEYLDNVLDTLDPASPAFDECQRELGRICGARKRLPQSLMLQDSFSILNKHPAASRNDNYIYEGLLNGSRARAEKPMVSSRLWKKGIKIFCREVVRWKRLTHPNVVPFLGVVLEDPIHFISTWVSGEELNEFIIKYPDTNRHSLLTGIADGLNYLHSRNVVHGDLSGRNILVDDSGCPQITSFGKASAFQNVVFFYTDGSEIGAPSLWTAPEILNGKETCSQEADIFSFAMVIAEVFAGMTPRCRCISTLAPGNVTLGEKRLEWLTHGSLTDELWELMKSCWDQDPHRRPKMSEVLRILRGSGPSPDEQQTPLPIGPPQPDPGRPQNPVYSYPDQTSKSHASLLTSSGSGDVSGEDVSTPHLDKNRLCAPLPDLPQPPTNCFSREQVLNEMLDLTDQLASVALFGPIGIGKSTVALTLLHQNQTQVKFGTNCYFMRCDDIASSLDDFLGRLSDVISNDHTMDVTRLRSHIQSSPPLLLLLDGADFILDPLAPEAEEISATIEEFGSYDNVCLVTTSRMNPDIHGFHRVEVPTLSEDGARDAFHSMCNLGRSLAVDNLIARLDFHPLSIDLLASSVRKNGWDEAMLLKQWGDDQTGALQRNYFQSLEDAVGPSFRSPTIQYLGTTARDALRSIAAFPNGIEESSFVRAFPEVAGVGDAIDILCKFSFIYRQDGFVKMLSPFRFYFLESSLVPVEDGEVIRWGPDCHPARALYPVFTRGPYYTRPPKASHATPRRRGFSREDWIKRLESVRRKLLVLFGRPRAPTIPSIIIQEEPVTGPPDTAEQQISPTPVAYEVE